MRCIILFSYALLSVIASYCTYAAPQNITTQPKFVITDFGAIGDGKHINTKHIQTTIDTCAKAGGGWVVVPKGVFLTGALFFKAGVNLLIEEGAVLKGTADPADYPLVFTRWEGIERMWRAALLNFDQSTNLILTGKGVIDGSGDEWLAKYPFPRRRQQTAEPNKTTTNGSFKSNNPIQTITPDGQTVHPSQRLLFGRPRLICISNSSNVYVSDLTLLKQASWCLHVLYCEDVTIENVKIDSILQIPSSDGIDVDSSKRVRIVRCDISCFDDNIAVKSGRDEDGRRVNRPSEDIEILDCRFGAGAGVAMGSEVSGGIQRVLVKNCSFDRTDNAARIKSQPSRGGFVRDIKFHDITLKEVGRAIDFQLAWRMVPPLAPPAPIPTKVEDVHLVNVRGTAKTGGVLVGLPESPFQKIRFENCHIKANTGLKIQFATNIDFSGLNLEVEQGEPLIFR